MMTEDGWGGIPVFLLIPVLIFGFILFVLTLLMPFFVYFTMGWTRRCHDQLAEMNRKLSLLMDRPQDAPPPQEFHVKGLTRDTAKPVNKTYSVATKEAARPRRRPRP